MKAAPAMAAQQQGEGGEEGVAALAEAEMEKARAQMAKVEADAALKQAENQRKFAELQVKAQKDQQEAAAKMAKLEQDANANAIKAQEALAKVDLLRAQTMKAMAEAGIAIDTAQLDEFKSLEDIDIKRSQEARAAEKDMREAARADRNEVRETLAPPPEVGQ